MSTALPLRVWILVQFGEVFSAGLQLDHSSGLDGVVGFVEGVRTGDAFNICSSSQSVDDSLLVFVGTGGQTLFFSSSQSLPQSSRVSSKP